MLTEIELTIRKKKMSETVRDRAVVTCIGVSTPELVLSEFNKWKDVGLESGKVSGEMLNTYEQWLEDVDWIIDALDGISYDCTSKSDGYASEYTTYTIVESNGLEYLVKVEVESNNMIDGAVTTHDKDTDTFIIDAVYYNGGTGITEIVGDELKDRLE